MPDEAKALERLIQFVRESRGFDFSGYRRSKIERQIAKRMNEVGAESYSSYADLLRLHPNEFDQLFNALLTKATRFFRDPQTCKYVTTNVAPALLEARPADSQIRIWCAGSGSGQEAYTMAMVFAQALGDEVFRRRVRIYASDIDDEALDYARLGAYLQREIEDVPTGALNHFFDRTEQHYVFRKDLRGCLIFGHHDLLQDPPIPRIDMLVCRNTLIYFTAEVQSQVLRRLHFALNDNGVLLLGKPEKPIAHSDLFTPADPKRRVFRKVVTSPLRSRARQAHARAPAGDGDGGLRAPVSDNGAPAQLILGADRVLVLANDEARRVFGLGINDVGRPIQDLEVFHRPVELRPRLEDLSKNRRPIRLDLVKWGSDDQERAFDVHMEPMVADGAVVGTTITYLDVTARHRMREESTNSKHELDEAYDELQSTEEGREAMREELEASNQELAMINAELRHRTLELHYLETSLNASLATIGSALAVIDQQQHVQIWNSQAKELWGLSQEEVKDHQLMSLDFGLPVERVKSALRATLNGQSEREAVVLDAVNGRGKHFTCRVTFLPANTSLRGNGNGALMMMEAVGN